MTRAECAAELVACEGREHGKRQVRKWADQEQKWDIVNQPCRSACGLVSLVSRCLARARRMLVATSNRGFAVLSFAQGTKSGAGRLKRGACSAKCCPLRRPRVAGRLPTLHFERPGSASALGTICPPSRKETSDRSKSLFLKLHETQLLAASHCFMGGSDGESTAVVSIVPVPERHNTTRHDTTRHDTSGFCRRVFGCACLATRGLRPRACRTPTPSSEEAMTNANSSCGLPWARLWKRYDSGVRLRPACNRFPLTVRSKTSGQAVRPSRPIGRGGCF